MNRILFTRDNLTEPSVFERALIEGEQVLLKLTKNMNNETDKANSIAQFYEKDKNNYFSVANGFIKMLLTSNSTPEELLNVLCRVDRDNFFSLSKLFGELIQSFFPNLSEQHLLRCLEISQHLINLKAAGIQGVLYQLVRNSVCGSWLRKNLTFFASLIRFLRQNIRFVISIPDLFHPVFQKMLRFLPEKALFGASNQVEDDILSIIGDIYTARKKEILVYGIDILRLVVGIGRFEATVLKNIIEDLAIKEVFSLTTTKYKDNLVFTDLFIPFEIQKRLEFLVRSVHYSTFRYHFKWFSAYIEVENDSSDSSILPDIVRFLVKMPQGQGIGRWLIIRQLLCNCPSAFVLGEMKMALFLDFLYFTDNAKQAVKPGLDCLLNSSTDWPELSSDLVEFLDYFSENFDRSNKETIKQNIAAAFNSLEPSQKLAKFDHFYKNPKIKEEIKAKLRELTRIESSNVIEDSVAVGDKVVEMFSAEQIKDGDNSKESVSQLLKRYISLQNKSAAGEFAEYLTNLLKAEILFEYPVFEEGEFQIDQESTVYLLADYMVYLSRENKQTELQACIQLLAAMSSISSRFLVKTLLYFSKSLFLSRRTNGKLPERAYFAGRRTDSKSIQTII